MATMESGAEIGERGWGMILHTAGFAVSAGNRLDLMIFVLAGRRIDSPDAEPARFPLRNVGLVRHRLLALFRPHSAETLVCSAACGADLLALETAGELGWRRFVVLPCDRLRFRETSVTDRPGDWGALYDRILDEIAPTDLIVLSGEASGGAYALANQRVLEEAGRLAASSGQSQGAVVVWDGKSYGPDDLTASFAGAARKRGMTVHHVSTLE
jgi:hypothetical protein